MSDREAQQATAENIRRLALELNLAIRQAYQSGVAVEVSNHPVQTVSQRHPQPVLYLNCWVDV